MGLSLAVQEMVLAWLKGQGMPQAHPTLYLSYHSAAPAAGPNEVSAHLGGRVALAPAQDLGEVVSGEDGLREVANRRALISCEAARPLHVAAIGLWTARDGGLQVYGARLEPAIEVPQGDPVVFYTGQLVLRATA